MKISSKVNKKNNLGLKDMNLFINIQINYKSYLPLQNHGEKDLTKKFAWWPIILNASNLKGYFKENFHQNIFFQKDISLSFM